MHSKSLRKRSDGSAELEPLKVSRRSPVAQQLEERLCAAAVQPAEPAVALVGLVFVVQVAGRPARSLRADSVASPLVVDRVTVLASSRGDRVAERGWRQTGR